MKSKKQKEKKTFVKYLVIAALLSILALGIFVYWYGAVDSQYAYHEQDIDSKPAEIAFDTFSIRDWGALGSGCRGGGAGEGNIHIRVQADESNSHLYRLMIDTGDYGLNDREPISESIPSFARECALRFAIYPEKGKQITKVGADTTFTFAKEENVEMHLASDLFVGPVHVDSWKKAIERDEVGQGEALVSLKPLPGTIKAIHEIGCEKPNILGLDLSASAYRDNMKPRMSATIKKGLIEIFIEVKDCDDISQSDQAISL